MTWNWQALRNTMCTGVRLAVGHMLSRESRPSIGTCVMELLDTLLNRAEIGQPLLLLSPVWL